MNWQPTSSLNYGFCPLAGQQVKHIGRALGDRGAMGRPGSVDVPATASSVEFGLCRNRHDHANLAFGMDMMRSDHRVHPHHIDAEHSRLGARLDDAAEPDAAGLALTEPSFGVPRLDQPGQSLERLFICRISRVEPSFQSSVKGTVADGGSDLTDEIEKLLLRNATRIDGHASLPFI